MSAKNKKGLIQPVANLQAGFIPMIIMFIIIIAIVIWLVFSRVINSD